MQTVILGRTGLGVSRIALGTWQLGGDWGAVDEEAATAAVRRAWDAGITLFDTAQAYGFGRSERLLAAALRTVLAHSRDEVVIATKGGLREEGGRLLRDSSPAALRAGVESSLRALGTDHIDLYHLHWPDERTPFEESAGALGAMVAEGKIRHVGVSNFSPAQMDCFARRLAVETVQSPYHLLRRGIEKDVLPYADAHGIGVLAYSPLAHGLLSGSLPAAFPAGDWRGRSPVFAGDATRRNRAAVAELGRLAAGHGACTGRLAVAWVLANPSVHTVIVGARTTAQVDDSVAADALALTEADLDAIDTAMIGSVPVGGPSPEGGTPPGA